MYTFRNGSLDYGTNVVSDETGLDCSGDPGKTQQSFAEEVNINTIVRRFGLTGTVPANLRVPLADEFVDIVDYHSAMNMIKKADEAFMSVPADLRSKFDNDAGRFVDFVSDPANLEEVRSLGLARPAPASPAPAGAQGGGAIAPGGGASAPQGPSDG